MATEPSPPLPPVAFRVGVSGHRLNRLQHADLPLLRERMRQVLAAAAAAAQRCAVAHTQRLPVSCRLLSSLAEGADRLAAEAALSLGWTLQAPLPFPQADYEADFTAPASLEAFRQLLACAGAVFELPAVEPPQSRALGYRAAGELVLRQCDLLLVVWDGEPAAGIGGTPEMIERAQAAGLPVLAIDAAAPHALRWLPAPTSQADPLAALATVVERQLMPSAAQRLGEAEYLRERWPRRLAASAYVFARLLGSHQLRLPRAPSLATAGAEIRNPILRPYFAWTDALALKYGERSRSAALYLQLLAAVAVLSGLLSIPFSEQQIVVLRLLACLELGATVALVAVALVVGRQPWHARWLRYRALAEQLRSLDLLLPLAEPLPQPPAAGFIAAQNEDFATLLFRAVTSAAGLPAALVDAAFLAREREAIRLAVEGQARFQKAVAARYGAAERTLRRLGLALFAVAMLLSVYDVARSFHAVHFESAWIITLAALLPALGAILAGLAAQGEYQRLAARAEAMSETLGATATHLQRDHPSLQALAATARAAAEVMTSEVRDWQALVAMRKPSLPG